MPVEVKHHVPVVLYIKQGSISLVLLKARVCAIVLSEFHILAVLYDWAALGNEVESCVLRVVDPYLMRTQMNGAVYCSIDKACPADTPDENLTVL